MTHRQAVATLAAVTAVWGATFTILKIALEHTSPMVLVATRFTLASLLMAFAIRGIERREITAGLIVGVLFWGGFVLQTNGLAYTTPSRAAFITALAVPLTPLIYLLVHRELPHFAVIGGVVLAAAGTYLLTNPAGGGLNRGDLLMLGSAGMFAAQIVAAGHFARRVAVHRLLLVQLALTALLSTVAAPFADQPMRFDGSAVLLIALVFLSCSAAGTFWLQLRAQRVVSPAETALVFSLEPVFAALVSWVVVGETLGAVQWAGGGLILAGMLLPELQRRRSAARAAPGASGGGPA